MLAAKLNMADVLAVRVEVIREEGVGCPDYSYLSGGKRRGRLFKYIGLGAFRMVR